MAQEGVETGVEAEPEAPAVHICLRCARALDPLQNFCPHCGAPTGYAASLPFEHNLVLGQTLGLIFCRACLTPGVPLRTRALDVLVLFHWLAYWGLFLSLVPIRVFVAQATVPIGLLVGVCVLLLHRLLRRRR